ncbi:hypothetical protein VNO78_11782 [Psophocarpus tetragonolobus]|uniref:Uncharacterized protein n=1 Tax=Psophocarpus tetragonolobus TaxID=3891 RepID=A0AAN9SME8_PSOTE
MWRSGIGREGGTKSLKVDGFEKVTVGGHAWDVCDSWVAERDTWWHCVGWGKGTQIVLFSKSRDTSEHGSKVYGLSSSFKVSKGYCPLAEIRHMFIQRALTRHLHCAQWRFELYLGDEAAVRANSIEEDFSAALEA